MVDSWRAADRTDQRRTNAARTAQLCAAVTVVIGAIVLVGHVLGNVTMVHLASDAPAMVTESALEFVVLGSVLLWWMRADHGWSRLAATIVGATVAAYSLLTLIIYISASSWEIAIATVPGPDGSVPATQSAHTAVLFLLYGMSLMLVARPRLVVARTVLIALSSAAVMVAAFGLVYKVTYLYRESGIIGMGVHTLIAFLLLNTAFLCARPNEGLLSLLTADSHGGMLARRLVPATLLVPFVIALVVARFPNVDGATTAEALLVVTSLTVAMVIGLAIYSSVQMHHADLERQVLVNQLSELASRDPLTGTANRRVFTVRVEAALESARAGRSSGVAVVIVDLDGLKPANDTFGHGAGDRLIGGVATLLAGRVRGTDLVARLGGDEFGILLTEVQPAAAEALVGRLVRAVANATFDDDNNLLRTTVSAGIAHTDDGRLGVDEFVRLADTAMYLAKASGGNDYAWGTPRTKGDLTDMNDTTPAPPLTRQQLSDS